jgi:hypothetical protein
MLVSKSVWWTKTLLKGGVAGGPTARRNAPEADVLKASFPFATPTRGPAAKSQSALTEVVS